MDLTGVAMLDRRRILAAAFAAMACPVCGVLPDPLTASGSPELDVTSSPVGTIAPRGIPTVQPSANATATSPDPPAASTRTPPLVLVAGSLAMEWPSLGLDAREMALKQAIRLPRPMVGDDAAFQGRSLKADRKCVRRRPRSLQ